MLASSRTSAQPTGCARQRVSVLRSPVALPSGAASRPQRARAVRVHAGVVPPGSLVLVAGATGGVGQLLTAKLLDRGYRVRAITRGNKGSMFSDVSGDKLELVKADLRFKDSVPAGLMDGVQAVVCCTGTTAFPTNRWDNDNGPKPTDRVAVGTLISLTPKSIGRFVYVTSAGVERSGQFPYLILNAFGVLTYKRTSEQALEAAGLPYTIIRPGRLTDGPYTSYDLNTLLKATAGDRRAVELALTDRLGAETSRIAVAEAIVQALSLASTEGKKFAMASAQGVGPGTDAQQWQALFAGAQP